MPVFHRSRVRPWLIAAGGVVVGAAVATGVVLLVTSGSGKSRGAAPPPPTTLPAPPFAVSSTTPVSGASGVSSDAGIAVHFTAPANPDGPLPTLTPPVAGTWTWDTSATVTFDASAPLVPGTTEMVIVPGGATGVRGAAGQALPAEVRVTFKVGAGSTLRLQQLLAQLGYLPVTFTASGSPPAANEAAQAQPGSFAWRWIDPLQGLESHWAPGDFGVMTTAAIMTFEAQRGLAVDGLAGPRLWTALLAAAGRAAIDPQPFDYVVVAKTHPETLTLYVNGAAKFAGILVNTGIPGVDTPDGTYPVFEHVTASEMKGRNLDGSTYDDPNVPWASYFFHGDALHGFVRATYGSPQSNGCVEMSIADAGAIWPYTPVGTLVTVIGPPA